MNKQELIENVKTSNNNLVDEFLKNGGKITICKSKTVRKTWSDMVRGGRQRIGRIDGEFGYAR